MWHASSHWATNIKNERSSKSYVDPAKFQFIFFINIEKIGEVEKWGGGTVKNRWKAESESSPTHFFVWKMTSWSKNYESFLSTGFSVVTIFLHNSSKSASIKFGVLYYDDVLLSDTNAKW